jgi:hypothetical protein
MKEYSKGQSLVELMVAIGVFVVVVAGLAFFIFDSFFASRLSYDLIKANLLAEEGVEAARSIRDNGFSSLIAGSYGLSITDNHWIFQGFEENIGSQLNNGKRVILIEDIDSDRKKITSSITWDFTQNRPEEIKLVSYLTNWQKLSGIEIRRPTAYNDPNTKKTTNPENAYDSAGGTTFATTLFDHTKNPSITFYAWQLPTHTYSSLVLKYRYHADQATNDRYAVAYSVTGCAGTFTDLIPLTSAGTSDTTISINISISQDLSQLCLKIYSEKNQSPDGKSLYTRDIWTEGIY